MGARTAQSQACFQTRDYWILVCFPAVCRLIYESALSPPILEENCEKGDSSLMVPDAL